MAKRSDFEQNFKKRVSLKQKIFRVLLYALVLLIIVSFVFMVGGRGTTTSNQYIPVVTVDGKEYDNRPGSPFRMIYNSVQQRFKNFIFYSFSPEELEQFAYKRSVEMLIDYALIHNFARKQGIYPTPTMLQNFVQAYGVQPSESFLEYVKMEYDYQALMGVNGDFANAISLYNELELYFFLELIKYTAEIEILYLNLTNFLSQQIDSIEMAKFYNLNNYLYAPSVTVDDMVFDNKKDAYKVLEFIMNNSWDAALDLFSKRFTLIPQLELSKKEDSINRYKEAVNYNPGEVSPNLIYENGRYHILKVVSFPAYKELNDNQKSAIALDYVKVNYEQLTNKYWNTIQTSINRAQNFISQRKSFSEIAKNIGFNYIHTAEVSPLNSSIYDQDNNPVDLPILNDLEMLNFIFTSIEDAVSQIFQKGDLVIILKVLKRGMNLNLIEQNLSEQIVQEFMEFKNRAISSDWLDMLKSKHSVVVNEKIKKIYDK